MILKLKYKYDKIKDEYITAIPVEILYQFKFPDNLSINRISLTKQISYISLAIVMSIAVIFYKSNMPLGLETLGVLGVTSTAILLILTTINQKR